MFKWLTVCALVLSSSAFAAPPKLIPGLQPSDVYKPLLSAGFNMSGPQIYDESDGEHYLWELRLGDYLRQDISFYVKIWAYNDVDNVYRIRLYSDGGKKLSLADQKAINTVLRLTAAINYPDAKPSQAADWVVGNQQKEAAQKIISGIEFEIDSSENKSHLVIGVYEPPQKNKKRSFILPPN